MTESDLGDNLIFLISQPRAGSTLAQRILGAHSQVCTTSEPWLLLHPVYALKEKGLQAEYNHWNYKKAVVELLDSIPDGRRHYLDGIRNFVSSLYARFGEANGGRLFLDKTPRYYYIIPELYELFPRARFILLLRDPVAVIASIIRTWTKDRGWRQLAHQRGDLEVGIQRLCRALADPGFSPAILRYEDLLLQPEQTARTLCADIGLDYEPEMLRYGESDQRRWGFGDQEKAWDRSGVDPANLTRWHSVLEDPQAWRVTFDYLSLVGKNRYSALGYDFDKTLELLNSLRPGSEEEVVSSTLPLSVFFDRTHETLLQRQNTQAVAEYYSVVAAAEKADEMTFWRAPLKKLRAYRRLIKTVKRLRLEHRPGSPASPKASSTGSPAGEENQSISFHVFYHDAERLARAAPDQSDPRFHFVDLDQLELPDFMRVEGMDANLNRALLSEYLGLLQIRPDSELVGCFTYSIPLKFSREWAHQTGGYETFLPEITFEAVAGGHYDPRKLYAPELKQPLDRFPEKLQEIHRLFPAGDKPLETAGPYKGSFIVTAERFRRFQEWFRGVVKHLMKDFSLDSWKPENSPYSSSEFSGKSSVEKEVDRLRHGLGDVLERAVCYYFAQTVNNQDKVRLGDHLRAQSVDRDLETLLRKMDLRGPLIIAFSNHGYLEILDNWLMGMRLAGVDLGHILIVSLDEKIHSELGSRGVSSFLMPCSTNLSDLWLKRMELFKAVVDLGIDFIHSDVDAVWLKDPLEKFFDDPEQDIIMSQGTVWPHDVHQDWGFVLCCGLFFVRGSKKMSCFLGDMLEDIKETKDDQVSFNRVVDRDELKWTVHDPYELSFKNRTFVCSRQPILGEGRRLRIKILPHHLVQRLHMPEEDAYVKHIYSEKTSGSKRDMLKSCGCYLLDDPGATPIEESR